MQCCFKWLSDKPSSKFWIPRNHKIYKRASIRSKLLQRIRHNISPPVAQNMYRVMIFYRYFHGHCSMEIKSIIPDPLNHVRPTRSSSQSHPFQVILSNPRTLSHKSSFIPRTCKLWNTLPSTSFPESYNLSSFKSNINKLDLISLSY